MAVQSAAVSSRVRFFEGEDIAQVADLHQRVFPTGGERLEEKSRLQRKYFSEVFLNSPDGPESLRSLVYCEGQRVTGFLGTVTRPMLWKGDRILARISTQFIVDPASRGLAGLELLRAFFSGPQDLSIADESNRQSRTIWEALGGVTSLVHSMQWLCPLRPFRMGLRGLSKTARLGPRLAAIGSPIGGCLDVLVSKLHANPFQPVMPPVDALELDAESMLECLAEFTSSKSLRPIYDSGLLAWLLQHAEYPLGQRAVQAVLVKSKANRILGWYIYRLSKSGISEVLQLFADKGQASDVLSHLAFHAASHGALALRGRCEPMLAEALSMAHWPCQWGPWVLVHSRRHCLSTSFQLGDVFFSRLDGEWCLRFSSAA